MRKGVFTSLFLLISLIAMSQPGIRGWRELDSLIRKKSLLGDALDTLHVRISRARLAGDYLTVARCYDYVIRIADLRTEDSLYFKNSAIIDTLLQNDGIDGTLKWAMHLMQAKRLSMFTTRYNRFNRQRYERRDVLVNYASMSNSEIDSLATHHFQQAKKISNSLQNQSVTGALWLSADPLLFLFEPGFYDIVIAEQINYTRRSTWWNVGVPMRKRIMTLAPDAFISLLDSLENAHPQEQSLIGLYLEWMQSHRSNKAIYYFIETLTRKKAQQLWPAQDGTEMDKEYEQYLLAQANSTYTAVRANAVYQLCLLWNQMAGKYLSRSNDFYRRGGLHLNREHFDTTYRYLGARAVDLYRKHSVMLDSFYYLKAVLEKMVIMRLATDLSISMDKYQLPLKPMLAEVEYKNVTRFYYRIVKVDSRARDGVLFNSIDSSDIFRLPSICDTSLLVPPTNDYNYHRAVISIRSLPPGYYRLLYSESPLNDKNEGVMNILFNVTNITAVLQHQAVFVVDRQTGVSIQDAKIRAYRYNQPTTVLLNAYATNAKGMAQLANQNVNWIEIAAGTDTTIVKVNVIESSEETRDDVYSSDEYDDLIEFYEENATAEIYTDRAIYRPGQTVHFKAIFLTKEKNTGNTIVMSKKQMGGKLFQSVYKNWLKDSEPFLDFIDPFGRTVDSLVVKPNDYGSVSGSFKIPKSAATGEWSIEPDYIEVGRNTGTFSVEEYKRPSYEITIDKPQKELRPRDTFHFTVKLKSFAGAPLSKVTVKYTLSRNGSLPGGMEDDISNEDDDEFYVDTIGYTNNEGKLDIYVVDSTMDGLSINTKQPWRYSYDLEVQTIDQTGESYEAKSSVVLSSRPINITLPFEKAYKRYDRNTVVISTRDFNAGRVEKDVHVKIFRLVSGSPSEFSVVTSPVDQWIYERADLEKSFPGIILNMKDDSIVKQIVLDTIINTGKNGRLVLDPAIFKPGRYAAEATTTGFAGIEGEAVRNFMIFDPQSNQLPEQNNTFSFLPSNSVRSGDSLVYYSGLAAGETHSIYHLTWYTRGRSKVNHHYEMITKSPGLHRFAWKIPRDVTGDVLLTQVFVYRNVSIKNTERVFVLNQKQADPEIIIEKYRTKLAPGATETFSVSIKTNDQHIAAELMTTLYDASLDKLEEHQWEMPREKGSPYLNGRWDTEINERATNDWLYFDHWRIDVDKTIRPKLAPLWWLRADSGLINKMALPSMDEDDDVSYAFVSFNGLMGRVPGVSVTNTAGLEEVVVTAYGTTKAMSVTVAASTIRIRGISSLTSYNMPLIILDGVVYTGDLATLDPTLITQAMVLKGAEATSIYGSRASGGVLVLSTKGDIIFPVAPPDPPMPVRKNFNETAFFFPKVYAGKDGYYSFTFTMPESVTEWNWKMLAHTKNAQFVYAAKTLNSQLPLMVQPNMPRLLYQGDRIVLQSRITNLDTIAIDGKLSCQVEDVVTGQDVTDKWLLNVKSDFSMGAKSTSSMPFELKVPKDQLHPVRIRIAGRSKNFADGEEHIIPVLSSKILVRHNMPFVLSKDSLIAPVNAPKDAVAYGASLSITSQPQATLVNSLPWLATYPYRCAEQTFAKLLAHATALHLMRNDPLAQQSFNKARSTVESGTKQNDEPADVPGEQLTPWLSAANRTLTQQQDLFRLLDTVNTIARMQEYLDRLYSLQNNDGGLAWFDGGKSNFYISAYVLGGFGKMEQQPGLMATKIFDEKYAAFIRKLINYCDTYFIANIKWNLGNDLDYLYARSYWLQRNPLSEQLKTYTREKLEEYWKQPNPGLHLQALLVTSTARHLAPSDVLYQKAMTQLRSLAQLAIIDEENGIRWKAVADREDMTYGEEETLAQLAEAFSFNDKDVSFQKGIIKWLLNAKNDDHWSSTKAGSAMVNLLLKEKKTVIGQPQQISMSAGGATLSVTNDLLNGNDYVFAPLASFQSIPLAVQDSSGVSGNLTWYYFTSPDSLTPGINGLGLKKMISRYNSTTNQWEMINEQTILKIGEKVKVTLVIETPVTLKYIYIDDKRGAAFEPLEIQSGYRYGSGFDYYESIRDAGVQLFSEKIPAGRSTIMYDMVVSQEGRFTNGPASLQCMYQPALATYSNSLVVEVKR